MNNSDHHVLAANKKNIGKRLDAIISDAHNLCDEILTKNEWEAYCKAADQIIQADISEKSNARILLALEIRNRLLSISSLIPGSIDYNSAILRLTFRPKGLVANFGNYINQNAYAADKKELIALATQLKMDFENAALAIKDDSMFKNPLFWTIVPMLVTCAYFLGGVVRKIDDQNTITSLQSVIQNDSILIKSLRWKMDSLTVLSKCKPDTSTNQHNK